ncbi:MAG: ABC transporter ATP-binding protein [Eubacteriales bacterium]|nr:ABC transporter ATP-binding protein [Eubacteriales bacterium]
MRVRLWDYLKRYMRSFLLALVFSVCACALMVLSPQLLGNVTTEIFRGIMAKLNGTGSMDFEAITEILKLLAGLYLLSSVMMGAAGWLMARISTDLTFRLREAVDKKLNVLPLSYFEERSVGDILSCITADVNSLGENISQSVLHLVSGTATVIGIAVMMMRISILLAAMLALIVLVAGLLTWLLSFQVKKYKKRKQELSAMASGYAEEIYSGRSLLKAFGQEEAALARFGKCSRQLYDISWRAEFYSDFMNVVMQSAAAAGYVAAVFLGGRIALQGQFSVGDIQAFIHYIRNIGQPVRQISQSAGMIQGAAASWQRIQAVLSEAEEDDSSLPTEAQQGKAEHAPIPPEVWQGRTEHAPIPPEVQQGKAEHAPEKPGAVRFSHVTFGYKNQPPVLVDFSADILPGQKVAVVGCTGIGKTTMVKLLMRFYDVREGAVYVDGVDVRSYDRMQLRSKFGVVLQDAWLFHGTVLDNIRYGRMDATREEVYEAARAARADAFIKRLPQGYDTMISEEKCSLSQGEKQQLTIARAILTKPEILILDEPSSAVDTLTEQRIREEIGKVMEGRTCFIIAHRPQTISGADVVLHMEQHA